MADPRFFTVAGPFALKDLAQIAQAKLAPGADPERLVHGVAPLESASAPTSSAFSTTGKYADSFARSAAGRLLRASRQCQGRAFRHGAAA